MWMVETKRQLNDIVKVLKKKKKEKKERKGKKTADLKFFTSENIFQKYQGSSLPWWSSG